MYESSFDDFERGADEEPELKAPPYSRPVSPPAGFKPPPRLYGGSPGAPAESSPNRRGLSALPSLAQSFKNAIVKPVVEGMRSVTQSPPVQQSIMQGQGFKPVEVDYAAPGNQPPANAFYRESAGQTEYQVPGKGKAVFQGQRKGGGSFTVAGSRTPEEQQAIDATVAGINKQIDAQRIAQGKPTLEQEQQQAARDADMASLLNWVESFAPAPASADDEPGRKLQAARMALVRDAFNAMLGGEQAEQQARAEQQKDDRRYQLDLDKLDASRMTAKQKADLSREWLQFQQWRYQQGREDKGLGKSSRVDRRYPKPAYQSPK